MPEMDGFKFLEEFQINGERRDVPVIVLTSKDLTVKDRKRLSGGVEKALAKGAVNRYSFLENVRRAAAKVAVRERASN